MVVIIFGTVASGKTTVAKELAGRLDAVHLNSDALRKELAGISPYERGGEEIYTPEFTEKVYRELLERTLKYSKMGKNVVVDATFNKKVHRDMFRNALSERGIPFHFVFLKVDDETAKRRIEKRKRELSVSDADFSVYLKMKESFQYPEAGEAFVVDGALPYQEVVLQIMKALGVGDV